MTEQPEVPQHIKFRSVFSKVLAAAKAHDALTKALVDRAMARHIEAGRKYDDFGDLGSEEITLAQQLGMNLHVKLRVPHIKDAKETLPKTPAEAAALLGPAIERFKRNAEEAQRALREIGRRVNALTGGNDSPEAVGAGVLLKALGEDAAINPRVRAAFGETWRNPRHLRFTPNDVELVRDAAAGVIANHLIPGRTARGQANLDR